MSCVLARGWLENSGYEISRLVTKFVLNRYFCQAKPSQTHEKYNNNFMLCFSSIGIGVLVKVNIKKEIVYYTFMYIFS